MELSVVLLRLYRVRFTGPEWDSSDEEAEIVAKTTTEKKAKKKGKENSKNTKGGKMKNKESDAHKEEDETEREATVLYIGHLPSEFEERDLKNFLQQFGKVVNLRISRSLQTGKSRGYAFVRWEDAETARIVADTLQGYFVGQRRLVCQPVPNPSKRMFFDTDKVIQRRQLRMKAAKQKQNRDLANVGKLKEITARLVQREQKKRAKLAALGIDYDFPGYEASKMAAEENEDNDDMAVQEESMKEETKEDNGDKEEAKSDKKKNKKKRKDSVDSIGSASSSSKKRKDSEDNEASPSPAKKSKRKESIENEASAGSSSSSKKKKRDRKDSFGIKGSPVSKSKLAEATTADATPTKGVPEKVVQSEKKSKKPKKNKKRRQSAP